jgi:hypothetical protein
MILFVRYWIGGLMIFAGIVVLVISPGGFGTEGFAMGAGGGLSVLLLNFLFRMGVSGDEERERHEEDWRFYERHGHWPDEGGES